MQFTLTRWCCVECKRTDSENFSSYYKFLPFVYLLPVIVIIGMSFLYDSNSSKFISIHFGVGFECISTYNTFMSDAAQDTPGTRATDIYPHFQWLAWWNMVSRRRLSYKSSSIFCFSALQLRHKRRIHNPLESFIAAFSNDESALTLFYLQQYWIETK